jgi:periplasmic copper chaperone A
VKLRRVWKSWGSIAVVGALASPAAASAHVTVQPSEAPAKAFVREDVRVPNEKDNANTTKIDVLLPDGLVSVSYSPVPGWSTKVIKQKLARPIKTDDGTVTEQVKRIIWTGGKIGPGQFQDFPLSLEVPGKAGDKLTFKAIQTYDNGDVVRWIGPPNAAEPAPQVAVIAASADPAGAATPAASSSGSKDDNDSKTLPIVALIVGALGLLAGGAALLSRRSAAQRPR